jgi:hypothetical protein
MVISNAANRTKSRLHEFIAHAKGGSPIALAGVIHFVRQELPLISPELTCSFAEQILESKQRSAAARNNRVGSKKVIANRVKRWSRNDHPGRSAPSAAADETVNCGKGK